MIDYKLIAKTIKESKYVSAFTGAGISVESGVPPFRGENGLWEKHGSQFAEISYFMKHQKESWKSLKKVFYDPITDVKPNKAHIVLANLEKMGIMRSIITQNIDNLHQEAGSKIVYELHGTAKYAVCIKCKTRYKITKEILDMDPPVCEKCAGILKPDFVFFGEQLPASDFNSSIEDADKSDLFIIVGTGGEVMPAAQIPHIAKKSGAKIMEINPEPSSFTNNIVDIYVGEKAGVAFSEIEKYL
ncbi:NAD-dependent deacylase [uncultured Brachyspira sp.]|uniref:NAD-dependent deacylase n=1 Tax=uncultured Brachyspira sp. TaxID=221953 RepID=UPI0025F567B9|nr:NAD-dependent deacylase [uncultured Brachyspira sp.]